MILRMRNISLVVLIASAVCFASDLSIQQSHRSIIKQLTQQTVNEIIDRCFTVFPASVAVAIDSTALNEMLYQDVAESFLSKNIAVFTSRESSDTLFEFSAYDVALKYGEPFTETLFGRRKVSRTISLSMQFSFLSQSHHKVIASQKMTVTAIDTINYADVQSLSDSSIPFSSVTEPQLSFFDSILEPAIVTVASAVVIYLFFTIRS